MGGDRDYPSRPVRRPPGHSGAAATAGPGGAYPTMARMVAQGTRAIDVARRAGIVYAVHEYAHDPRSSLREGGRGYALEAVAALGLDPARRVQDDRRRGRREARSGRRARRRRGGPEGRRGRARRPEAARSPTPPRPSGRPATCSAGSARWARSGRCPTVIDGSAAASPTIHVSAGRRGLEIELPARDLVRLTGAVLAPIARPADQPAISARSVHSDATTRAAISQTATTTIAMSGSSPAPPPPPPPAPPSTPPRRTPRRTGTT